MELKAHSDDWNPVVLCVNIGVHVYPCCFNCNKATLFLSNFMKNLRHACFCFWGWKSNVGENQRGILKGIRTEFKLVLYSVISRGCQTRKSVVFWCGVLFFSSSLKTLNFCYASMALNGACGQLSIFCSVFVHKILPTVRGDIVIGDVGVNILSSALDTKHWKIRKEN